MVGGRCGVSFVIATPEMLAAAATDLESIGSTISAGHAAARAQTTGMMAAGAASVGRMFLCNPPRWSG